MNILIQVQVYKLSGAQAEVENRPRLDGPARADFTRVIDLI